MWMSCARKCVHQTVQIFFFLFLLHFSLTSIPNKPYQNGVLEAKPIQMRKEKEKVERMVQEYKRRDSRELVRESWRKMQGSSPFLFPYHQATSSRVNWKAGDWMKSRAATQRVRCKMLMCCEDIYLFICLCVYLLICLLGCLFIPFWRNSKWGLIQRLSSSRCDW